MVPPVCNICGEGNAITIPDGKIAIPSEFGQELGDVDLTCEQLQLEVGSFIPADICPLITPFISVPCGCGPASTGDAPTDDAPTDDSAAAHAAAFWSLAAVAALVVAV